MGWHHHHAIITRSWPGVGLEEKHHTIITRSVKKCTHGGYPLECPFVHVIPTWCLSTNQLPRLTLQNALHSHLLAHSSLVHLTVQDGEFAAIARVVLYSCCGPVWPFEDAVGPAYGPWMPARPVSPLYAGRATRSGQDVALGPSHRQRTRPRGALPSYGWWVLFSMTRACVLFLSLFIFYWFLDVFPGLDFLRTVLWPIHLCPCPRQVKTQLGRAFLGSKLFFLFLFFSELPWIA